MSCKIVFGEPKQVKTQTGVSFCSVPIMKENPDGTREKLNFVTEKCFSWGAQEEGKNYKLPIVMTGMDGSTTEGQKKFLDFWVNLVSTSKEHCLKIAPQIRPGLTEVGLGKIGCCLYRKKDKLGRPVEDSPLMLYPKIKRNPKTGKNILLVDAPPVEVKLGIQG